MSRIPLGIASNKALFIAIDLIFQKNLSQQHFTEFIMWKLIIKHKNMGPQVAR
jgi:hypothetical protein